DAEQPRAESLALLVPIQRAVRADEGILHRILGLVRIGQEALRQANAAGVIALDEERERVALARPHAANDRRIREELDGEWRSRHRHHTTLTRRTPLGSHGQTGPVQSAT